jgi:hypothetical protein
VYFGHPPLCAMRGEDDDHADILCGTETCARGSGMVCV